MRSDQGGLGVHRRLVLGAALRLWRDAERLVDDLPAGFADRSKAERTVREMRELYAILSGQSVSVDAGLLREAGARVE